MPKNKRSQWTDPHFDKGILAVAYIAQRQLKILAYDDDHENEAGRSERIVLVINPSARGIDLSNLSEEELDIFKYIIDKACELARPICRDLDQQTEQARLINDTRYRRLWRAKPQLAEFPRESHSDNGTDNQRLPERPRIEGDEPEHDKGVPSRP